MQSIIPLLQSYLMNILDIVPEQFRDSHLMVTKLFSKVIKMQVERSGLILPTASKLRQSKLKNKEALEKEAAQRTILGKELAVYLEAFNGFYNDILHKPVPIPISDLAPPPNEKNFSNYQPAGELLAPRLSLMTSRMATPSATSRSNNNTYTLNLPPTQVLSLAYSKIQTFLTVHPNKQLSSAVHSLNTLVSSLSKQYQSLQNELSVLTAANSKLTSLNKVLQDEITVKIKQREDENLKITFKKGISKDDVLSIIKEEYDSVKENYEGQLRQLEAELEDSIVVNRRKDKEINEFKKIIGAKNALMVDKGVQFAVLDVFNFPEYADTHAYYDSINTFIVGGQVRGKDWVLPLVTDILSHKVWADHQDFKSNRLFSTMKEFLLEFFFKQFGCRKTSLSLLRDFLVSCKSTFMEEHRINVLLDLCGFYELKHKHNQDLKTYIEKNKVAYQSPSSNCLFSPYHQQQHTISLLVSW